MNVVIEIEGREAIPVRAIPLLTNWNFFSPDVVANIFAEHKGNHGFYYGELQALRIENGHVNPLKREWWVSWAARELGALSEKIKRTGLPDEVGYQQWRDESLPLLPAGVFVWKDDFEQFHARNWNIRLRVFSSSISTGEDSGEVNPQMSRALVSFINDGLSDLEKWHELDFTPYIRPALSKVVMEGLPILKSRARVTEKFSEAAPANDAKTERQAKIDAMREMMKSIRYLETEAEPGQEIEDSDAAASAHQRALNEIAERRHVALSGYPEPCSPMQTVASNAAPVETERASESTGWAVNKPRRYHGYSNPLYRFLAAAHREGEPRPTGRDVLEEWRANKPAEIAQVLTDGIDYYDNKGDTKFADLEAIRKAIDRMTSAR